MIQIQKIRQPWLYFILLGFILTFIVLLFFLRDDVVVFYSLICGIIFTISITIWLYSIKMVISITSSAIIYKSPLLFVKGEIEKSNVKAYEIKKSNPFQDFGGWGIRYNTKGYKGFIFEGELCLFIELKSGEKRAFSLREGDAFSSELQKMLDK